MKFRLTAIIVLMVVVAAVGCEYSKSEVLPDCATVPAKFSTDVLPLIHSKCAIACHNTLSTNKGGPLTNYTEIKNKASLVKFMVETRQMPQVGSLTDAEIKVISCWVDAGAENN
jgi:hypothetical protein